MNKTKEGGMEGLLSTAICMFVILITLVMVVNFIGLLTAKRHINHEARSMLLRLEENGELTTSDTLDFKQRMTGMGLDESSYTITYNETNVKKNHGEIVSLDVDVEATPSQLGLLRVFDYIQDTYQMSIHLESMMRGEVT